MTTKIERDGFRERSNQFASRLRVGEHRDLSYTLIAIAVIVLLGAIIVPLTISRTSTLPVASDAESLATQYLQAVAKVKGFTPPASAATVVQQYGADGGKTCTTSLQDLYQDAIVKPKAVPGARGASHVDRVKLEQTRVALRVYCPTRDAQFATYLKRA